MSRRKGWMFFALGLILALSAAAMVFVFLRDVEAKPPVVAPPPPTTKLPVAARPLEPGMKISSQERYGALRLPDRGSDESERCR